MITVYALKKKEISECIFFQIYCLSPTPSAYHPTNHQLLNYEYLMESRLTERAREAVTVRALEPVPRV